MAEITILAVTNSAQSGIIIKDKTNWSVVGGSRSSLTSLIVNLFQGSMTIPKSSYNLTVLELETFIETGEVEILFASLAGVDYLGDGWWILNVVGNYSDYTSNFSGFGLYASITYLVYGNINSLHVPEEIKYNAEKYAIMAMFLEGIKFLDTSDVNSREIKFNKRLLALQKMLLKI